MMSPATCNLQMKPDLPPETVSNDDDDGGGGINGDSGAVTSDENDVFSDASSRLSNKSK